MNSSLPAQAPIRLAVIGGRRGSSFTHALQRLQGRLELAAICDIDESVLATWTEKHPEITTCQDYREVLADPSMDAVIVATPIDDHADQTVAALQAGKHVLCEVLAARTVEDCWRIVEATEASDRIYMMAENSCYTRQNQLINNMAGQGLFGQITHLSGGYLHDTRDLAHHPDGSLTWRGESRAGVKNVSYVTHAFGPLMHWLHAANGPDDLPVTLTAASSGSPAQRHYAQQRFGSDHPAAQDGFWAQGDTGTVLITTASGAVITVRVDTASPRPHGRQTTYHELQGSLGAYLAPRQVEEDPLVWVEDPETIGDPGRADHSDHWLSLWDVAERFEHPLWDEWFGHENVAAGHDGGDFFILERFVSSIEGAIAPPVDVYAGATWSVIADLSAQSIAAGGAVVDFPDFQKPRAGRF